MQVDPYGLGDWVLPWKKEASWNVKDTAEVWGNYVKDQWNQDFGPGGAFTDPLKAGEGVVAVKNQVNEPGHQGITVDLETVGNNIVSFGDYASVEAHAGFGLGMSVVECCDENGRRNRFYYYKWCTGGAFGASAGVGGVIGINGSRCRAENYEGWFLEVGGTAGVVGYGADIGYTDSDVDAHLPNIDFGKGITPGKGVTLDAPLPGELSGVYEGGPTVGLGAQAGATWCRYSLMHEEEAGCCSVIEGH